MIAVEVAPTFDAWRAQARACLQAEMAPDSILWRPEPGTGAQGQQGLFAASAPPTGSDAPMRSVPQAFMRGARSLVYHRDAGRFDLLYRMLWRLTHGTPHLLEVAVDPDTRAFRAGVAQVDRDVHKCHAFVRFRQVCGANDSLHYVAWYRPDHRVLRLAAPHFVQRFHAMRWTILTADESVQYDGKGLLYGAGVPRSEAPSSDELESLWKVYYAHIFNPARVKVGAMKQEMPRRYWGTLPE
ncbi:MAG: DUF4130 domain-containing protein, partial [Deltaproteobacteria bacterium]